MFLRIRLRVIASWRSPFSQVNASGKPLISHWLGKASAGVNAKLRSKADGKE
jgi:hypothetical protein